MTRLAACCLLAAALLLTVTGRVHAQAPSTNTRVTALVGLARTARDQKHLDEAMRYFKEADRLAPFENALLVEFFWTAHQAGARSDARALGRRVLVADPREARVRDGMVGLAAEAADEDDVRTLAVEGAALTPHLALWPRRLAESRLRVGDYPAAARAFWSAAALAGAVPSDRAQGAMAQEMSGDKPGAMSAWAAVEEAVWSTRPEWVESRARALAPVAPPAPVVAAAPKAKTPEEIASASVRALRREPCALAPLAALERMADPRPFLDAVADRSPSCPAYAEWAGRAVERAIADGAFDRALKLARDANDHADAPIELQEQLGVLLHWTGRHVEAEPVLRKVVAQSPNRTRAGIALIEVRRAIGDADGAWDMAQSYWTDTAPATDRMALAELALETGRLTNALTRAQALESDLSVRARARAVMGSAALALGRPAEARSILAELIPEPGPSLAWLDAVAATDGVAAALSQAVRFPDEASAAWADVIARRAVWQMQLGHRRESERLIAALTSVDPARARLAQGEIALASSRPADAERTLREALASQPRDLRALDGLTTALAEQGRWDEAFAALAALRKHRPHEARWALREAEWRDRQAPSARTLDALETVVRDNPHADGRSALARAYFRIGQYDRALATLGADRAALSEHDLLLAARCLRAADRSAEAVSMLGARKTLPINGLLLRAELTAAHSGPAAVRDEFIELTGRPDADPGWYVVWADVQRSGPELVKVLNEGATRFPDHALLQERLAVAAWAARDRALALRAADAALAADDLRTGAWFVKVDLASTGGPPAVLVDLLGRFEARFTNEPSARIGMADMLAGLTRSAQDPAARRALGWIAEILAAEPGHAAATVTEARLHAALGDLPRALRIIDTLVEQRPELPAALKLKAELLAAGGRYKDAVDAFDRYLALAPGDLAARRQQARIDGWRGAFDASLTRYRRLREDAPPVPAVAAEAEAKRAYYRGEWSEAIERYNAWLAIEPDDVEAQLERAQVHDRLGDPRHAAEAFRHVAADAALNDVALAAADRIERRRRASVDLFAVGQSAAAAERRQLLDLVDAGAGVSDNLGIGYRTRVRVFGGPSLADIGDRVWRGRHVGGQLATSLAAPLRLAGSLVYRKLDPVEGEWFGDLALTWRAQSALRFSAGFERSLLLENRTTLADGIAGVGPVAGVRWTPNTDVAVEVRGTRSDLSDGNRRQALRLAASERVLRGVNEVRLVLQSELLSYRQARDTYFTPSGFWRHDVGAEWRGWLATPRFFGDRERWVSALYLLGYDERREQYHTGRLGLSYELANGVSVVADGQLIRSRVYNGGRLSLGLRFKHVALPEP